MKLEKVKKQYKNQWILAKVLKEKPETHEPEEVEVIEHSRSRNKTYQAMQDSDENHLMHFYNGPIPKKGYAVAF